jgi:uncharacterized protein YukE
MSDTIYYNYGANYDHLDAIKANINDATALREEVHGVFNALAEVYVGEAATALQAHHHQCSQQMDAGICELQATHGQAVDRQGLTAAHDHMLAQGF